MKEAIVVQTKIDIVVAAKSASESRKAKMEMGGRRDSNPQQPGPQPGALPLSYDHREALDFRFCDCVCNGQPTGAWHDLRFILSPWWKLALKLGTGRLFFRLALA